MGSILEKKLKGFSFLHFCDGFVKYKRNRCKQSAFSKIKLVPKYNDSFWTKSSQFFHKKVRNFPQKSKTKISNRKTITFTKTKR